MDAIMDVAKKHKLYVIEDCAQAHGATYKGKLVGTFGDVGCFSFYPTKPIGAFGDAGAIVTNNDELLEKLCMLRNYGSKIKYKHEIIGVNSRLDELQAALLSVSLNHVQEGNDERKVIANRYLSEINNPAIVLPSKRPDAEHIYHVFAIRCKRRENLYNYLIQHDIHTQIHYPVPCHLASCYSYLNHKVGEFPKTELYANEELSLPIYVGMPDHEVSYVINTINNYQDI
jgi:dTDP-4-amino-4,6-dideoxygalactose transaminase